MLVLTRKPGERILVGDDIVITLVSVRRDEQYGDRIRIGLDAPSNVPIRREEVPDQREAGRLASAESSLDSLEGESRQLDQKIRALECQAARESRSAEPDPKHVSELSAALTSLRHRCDELLEQLAKTVQCGGEP